MKSTSRNIFLLVISLMILSALGCKKEKTNQQPSISFVQPDNNLIITSDTVLIFKADPRDEDGEIEKVEFLINGLVVQTITQAPYQFEWLAKIENAGMYTIKAIAWDKEGASAEAEINLEIRDYRNPFTGDFYFRVIIQHWVLGQPTTYDTSFYSGVIRKYELADSENDLSPGNDSEENPDKKITIEFSPDTRITSLISEDGTLIPKSGHHYGHSGAFVNVDKIKFFVGGMGGLGGGWNYDVEGTRKP